MFRTVSQQLSHSQVSDIEGPISEGALGAEAFIDEESTNTEDDTEPDADARPRGYGPRGSGPPLKVLQGRRRRELQDGGGRCSPGRWEPEQRPVAQAPRLVAFRAALLRQIQDMAIGGTDMHTLFADIAAGQLKASPFDPLRIQALLAYAEKLWGADVHPRSGDRASRLRLRLLQCLLRDADDADVAGLDHVAVGVPIGVGARLPRTPAVYHRRRRWKLAEQEDPQAWQRPWDTPAWRDNYGSAQAVSAEITRQLEESVAKGQALRMTEQEVKEKWPDAAVSSLGALTKQSADGTTKVRILMDGTYGVHVNDRIRVRDKDRGPGAPDIKRLLRAQSRRSRPTLGLAVDVADAHRLIQVRPEDWRFQVCRAHVDGPLYAFTCGVFGIASIAYWWGRVAGALLRTLHHLAPRDLELWVLLVADDFKIESTAANPQVSILFTLLLFEVLGVPLQWEKTGGGVESDWVGYNLQYRIHAIGLSESRAEWAANWCSRHAEAGFALMSELREGLGRLSFVAGALTFERPFLSPLFAYLSFHPAHSTRPLPIFVRVILHFLAQRLRRRRHYQCGGRESAAAHGPRVDARAEGQEICVGGWLPTEGEDGKLDTARSPWFSVVLDRESAPWAYSKRDEPYRTIASLEAFGALLAVVTFEPWIKGNTRGQVTFTAWTDNQGNASALGRLMTSSFPLCVIIMELSCVLEALGLNLELAWTPRDNNREADALSNELFAGFDISNRVKVDLKNIKWHCLNTFMSLATDFYKQKVDMKAAGGGWQRGQKRRRQDRLRVKEPW